MFFPPVWIIYRINVWGNTRLNFNYVIHHPLIEQILNLELKQNVETKRLFFPSTIT